MRGAATRAGRGFTLVELMIVVAIIGLLASMALPGYAKVTLRARQRERVLHFEGYKRALVNEFRTTGRLPECTATFAGPTAPGELAPFFPRTQTGANAPGTCFRKIPYRIDGGTRYRWYLTIDATRNYFLLYAIGDANRDGNQVYYVLSCTPDERADCKPGGLSWVFSTPMQDEEELDDIPVAERLRYY